MEDKNIKKLFSNLKDKETLNFIESLNAMGIPNAITGSSSLYIHGEFGRMPNDIDLYTTEEHLTQISETWGEMIEEVTFPPVHWIEVENKFGIHLLAKLECIFEDGRYYNFSHTELLQKNLSKYEVNGKLVRVVPPEEVLLLKLTAPRKNDKKDDIADVENYLKHNELNKEYFNARAEEVGVLDIVSKYV